MFGHLEWSLSRKPSNFDKLSSLQQEPFSAGFPDPSYRLLNRIQDISNSCSTIIQFSNIQEFSKYWPLYFYFEENLFEKLSLNNRFLVVCAFVVNQT